MNNQGTKKKFSVGAVGMEIWTNSALLGRPGK